MMWRGGSSYVGPLPGFATKGDAKLPLLGINATSKQKIPGGFLRDQRFFRALLDQRYQEPCAVIICHFPLPASEVDGHSAANLSARSITEFGPAAQPHPF
jgi:hypothetical protein